MPTPGTISQCEFMPSSHSLRFPQANPFCTPPCLKQVGLSMHMVLLIQHQLILNIISPSAPTPSRYLNIKCPSSVISHSTKTLSPTELHELTKSKFSICCWNLLYLLHTLSLRWSSKFQSSLTTLAYSHMTTVLWLVDKNRIKIYVNRAEKVAEPS